MTNIKSGEESPKKETSWYLTPAGKNRGYIQPGGLRELWFHTGTDCNLNCPFCYEGSGPGNNRIQPVNLGDIRPFLEEGSILGVKQFSFTGGEPFVSRGILEILDFALELKPCLVLTNATEPLLNRLHDVATLKSKNNPLSFRISLDSPNPDIHDSKRGKGHFKMSLKVMEELHRIGFRISVARRLCSTSVSADSDRAFIPFFLKAGLPENTNIVSFPDLLSPGSNPDVPHITETCMTTYKTHDDLETFMCYYSKMVVKKSGHMRVYACTLVDDDDCYDLGNSLTKAMKERVMLRHHRCYGCFSCGTSCSETQSACA